MLEKLKPCPFCGDEHPFVNKIKTNFFEDRYAVMCENCQSMGKYCKTEDQAIEAWNRRTSDDES